MQIRCGLSTETNTRVNVDNPKRLSSLKYFPKQGDRLYCTEVDQRHPQGRGSELRHIIKCTGP